MERSRAASKRQERTEAIVDSAKRLFDEHGYDKVTMRDIAEAVGISPGLIYRYKSSKSEILEDIILQYIQEQAVHLAAIEPPAGTAQDRLMYYLREMFAFDLERIELRRLAVSQSWNWDKGAERSLFVEVFDVFEPIMASLSDFEIVLDISARWAIWAIYTEALRRAAFDITDIEAFEKEIGPQIDIIIRGCESRGS